MFADTPLLLRPDSAEPSRVHAAHRPLQVARHDALQGRPGFSSALLLAVGLTRTQPRGAAWRCRVVATYVPTRMNERKRTCKCDSKLIGHSHAQDLPQSQPQHRALGSRLVREDRSAAGFAGPHPDLSVAAPGTVTARHCHHTLRRRHRQRTDRVCTAEYRLRPAADRSRLYYSRCSGQLAHV